jgi:hypothetical protein
MYTVYLQDIMDRISWQFLRLLLSHSRFQTNGQGFMNEVIELVYIPLPRLRISFSFLITYHLLENLLRPESR